MRTAEALKLPGRSLLSLGRQTSGSFARSDVYIDWCSHLTILTLAIFWQNVKTTGAL